MENEKAAEELYKAMGIYMNTLEFNNVISEKDGILHYYVGNSGAMHETKVGGYIFMTLYETINLQECTKVKFNLPALSGIIFKELNGNNIFKV